MNVPFRNTHNSFNYCLSPFDVYLLFCEKNSHHIAITSAMYLITVHTPFPPQVQVPPVTPVTSICQVSWSRLCISHDFFFSLNSFLFLFFCLVLYSHPHLIHLALMLCHQRRRSLKWQPEKMSSLKADINIWLNILNVFWFFWLFFGMFVSYCHANYPQQLSLWITFFSLNRESSRSVLDDFSLASVSIFSLWAWPLLWVNKQA